MKIARFMIRIYPASSSPNYEFVWNNFKRIFKLIKPYLNPGNLNLNTIFDFFAGFTQFFVERNKH